MTQSSELRQANTSVTLVGFLKEKDLKVEPTNRQGTKVNAIRGHFVVRTAENSEHTVKVFTYETTNAGAENKSFASLKVMMDDFVSEAELLQAGEDKSNADMIECKGTQLRINEYFNQQKALISRPEINASFVSRVKDKNIAKPMAEFKAEVVFNNFRPEIVKDEETGRLIVDAYLPMYGGTIAPITFIIDDADTADYISDNYSKGLSGEIWGEIVNRTIVEKKEIKGFGKSREEMNFSYVNELIITGGQEEQYDPESEKAWSKEVIKKALTEREMKLDELKNKERDDSGSKKGFGNSTAKQKKKNTDDDIPF